MFLSKFKEKQEDIHRWLESREKSLELPLYSSVDIRDSGFKVAVVDTNLFPAGFNNLCEHGLDDSIRFFKDAILRRVPGCKNILLIAEEHTRNTWYLENVRILQEIIEKSGFHTKIATFLSIQPDFCETMKYVELETATGHSVRIHCFKRILSEIEQGREQFDLIIMNNDLSTGIPDVLRKSKIPIYPSLQAGWHARSKSHHFSHTNELLTELGNIIGIDPWFFSCLFKTVDKININNDADRDTVADAASDLFAKIQVKYDQHGITEKPYVVLKSDSGTYGMGVMTFESPDDIRTLNRKDKNKLYKGKGSQVIERYLIQEGVSTIYNTAHGVCEVSIYQVENNLVGGFYRTHPSKGSRENLNAQGATFSKMCPHLKKYGDCGVHHDMNIFDVYRILARVAGIAAHREIVQLEAQAK